MSESAQDIADRAANSYNKEFLFHQSNNERQLLQMVDSALDRIREGTFGQCISCGAEINPKRLEAVPWTRHLHRVPGEDGERHSGAQQHLGAHGTTTAT